MKRLITQFTEEFKKNWPSHIITLLIGLSIGLSIACYIVNTVEIGGHKYEVNSVFHQEKITEEELISKPFEIGRTGGFVSIAIKAIDDAHPNLPIAVRYETSYDKKSWHDDLNSNNYIINKEIETNKWLTTSLYLPPSAYVRFIIQIDRKNINKDNSYVEMEIFRHM